MDSKSIIQYLSNPALVAQFQRFCGVIPIKPGTCDQETQTRRDSSNSDQDGESRGNKEEEDCPKCMADSNLSDVTLRNRKNCGHSEKENDAQNNNSNNYNNNLVSNNGHAKQIEQDQELNSLNEATTRLGTSNGHVMNGSYDEIKGKNGLLISNEKDFIHGKEDDSSEERNSAPPPPPVQIKYKSLLYLAHFGAFLGNEEFYLTFFPFFIWNVDFLIVRQVAPLWCLVMYMGQAAKDLIRWPRPSCPPVVRLESAYLQEFAMPSTHAMAGTAIPLFIATMAMSRYQVPFVAAAIFALSWYTVTCFSRLYLGVHSVLDLIAGTAYALVIFLAFVRYSDHYDLYQQMHPFAALMVLVTALLLCTVCYPSNSKKTSRGNAVQIVAACAGAIIGAWMGYQLGYMREPEVLPPYTLSLPSVHCCLMSGLRFLVGLAVLVSSYLCIKMASIRAFSYLYGLDAPDKTNMNVMVAYKFTTYGLLGIIISFVIPVIHLKLGIERASLFTEVL